MSQNLVEKIAQRYAVGLADGQTVRAGDFLSVRPAHVMTHDNTAAVIPKFESMGASRVADSKQPVFTLDHDIQNESEGNLAKYAKIKTFAKEQGVAFFPAGRGIGHQVMVEEGFVLPGTFVVASDSHSNLYGGLGALGTPVVRTDAAAIWATGRTWWQVPPVVRVQLSGKLAPGVTGKDVIIALIGVFNKDEVLNCCLEFTGAGVASLRIDERLAIANMTTEWGALAGVFPCDEVTKEFLLFRAEIMRKRGDTAPTLTPELVVRAVEDCPVADADAVYEKDLELDLSAVTPFVAGPNEVKTITPLPEIEEKRVKIHKAYLLSCVNGRLEDFASAAEVLKDKKVADGVTLYVAAASSEVQSEAARLGYWDTLLQADATALPPGCGPCIGLGDGVLKENEVGISATNRNFKGRMGAPSSQVYLANPAVVAASAVAGYITAPPRGADSPNAGTLREALQRGSSVRTSARPAEGAREVKLVGGFPATIEGELLFVPKDNMNTDGIYGKEFTYQDGLAPQEMGSKAMLNYDPQFQRLARDGDILAGGYNFGSGSSREQAATALKFRGLQMVIAGSYSQTYKRNAFNNGYVVIECPELIEDLKAAHTGADALSIRTGTRVIVDFTHARITANGKDYAFAPLGEVAQELITKGGFEALIREQIAQL
ncbi:MAG: homoaconitase [Phycisphaerales bacterium]|nr:MAG: homoaconitase [Phycisphaerales bacterium]